ncbi:unnamed protein product, partial [Discosporangium mesarthrocarpum]
ISPWANISFGGMPAFEPSAVGVGSGGGGTFQPVLVRHSPAVPGAGRSGARCKKECGEELQRSLDDRRSGRFKSISPDSRSSEFVLGSEREEAYAGDRLDRQELRTPRPRCQVTPPHSLADGRVGVALRAQTMPPNARHKGYGEDASDACSPSPAGDGFTPLFRSPDLSPIMDVGGHCANGAGEMV